MKDKRSYHRVNKDKSVSKVKHNERIDYQFAELDESQTAKFKRNVRIASGDPHAPFAPLIDVGSDTIEGRGRTKKVPQLPVKEDTPDNFFIRIPPDLPLPSDEEVNLGNQKMLERFRQLGDPISETPADDLARETYFLHILKALYTNEIPQIGLSPEDIIDNFYAMSNPYMGSYVSINADIEKFIDKTTVSGYSLLELPNDFVLTYDDQGYRSGRKINQFYPHRIDSEFIALIDDLQQIINSIESDFAFIPKVEPPIKPKVEPPIKPKVEPQIERSIVEEIPIEEEIPIGKSLRRPTVKEVDIPLFARSPIEEETDVPLIGFIENVEGDVIIDELSDEEILSQIDRRIAERDQIEAQVEIEPVTLPKERIARSLVKTRRIRSPKTQPEVEKPTRKSRQTTTNKSRRRVS